MMNPDSHPDTLITITCDEQGLKTMILAAVAAIQQGNDWNFGDEYDIDVTPYHEMRDSLIKKYTEVYGPFKLNDSV